MQKKISAFLILWLILPLVAGGAELATGEQETLFIEPVRIQPSLFEKAKMDGHLVPLQRAADILESEFASALSSTRVFQLVERKELAVLAKEQEINAGSNVIPDDSAVATATSGRLLGAKFVLIPILDGFEELTTTQIYTASGRADVTRDLFFSAQVKIVHTASGALLPDVPSIQLKKREVLKNLTVDAVGKGEEFLVTQTRELARQLAQEAVATLRPAQILAVSGKQIVINRGTEAGFKSGDLVEIFAVDDIRDPASGATYRKEMPVGQARIVRIDKVQSFAIINDDDLGITVGGVVRRFHSTHSSEQDENKGVPATVENPGSSEKPLKW